jgi:hypothetical protein
MTSDKRDPDTSNSTSALWSSESVYLIYIVLYTNKSHLAEVDLKSIKKMIGLHWDIRIITFGIYM